MRMVIASDDENELYLRELLSSTPYHGSRGQMRGAQLPCTAIYLSVKFRDVLWTAEQNWRGIAL